MVSSRQLTLYGAPASIERAQALLEAHTKEMEDKYKPQ